MSRAMLLAVIAFVIKQSSLSALEYKVNLIYEKNFDAKIEEVVWGSFTERGGLQYYPKIVIFETTDTITIFREHNDERIAGQRHFPRSRKEIRIFSQEGETIATIRGYEDNFYAQVSLYASENGKHFAVLQQVWPNTFYDQLICMFLSPDDVAKLSEQERNKITRSKFEARFGNLIESSLVVYNDKGAVLWKQEPWHVPLDADCWIAVSPKDGSMIYGCGPGEAKVYNYFNSSGQSTMNITERLHNYMLGSFAFSKNWQYIAVGAQKYPTQRYERLPGESSEPVLLFLDSRFNVNWEKSIGEYIMDWVIISPLGSYVGVGAHTVSGTLRDKSHTEDAAEFKVGNGLASSKGVIFDIMGNFVMPTSWSGYVWREQVIPFSSNERYFLNKNNNVIFVTDMHTRQLVYDKELSDNIISASVSDNGKVLAITERRVITEHYSTGRPKSFRFERFAYLLDEYGDIVWQDETHKSNEIINFLGWHRKGPIISVLDTSRKGLTIERVAE